MAEGNVDENRVVLEADLLKKNAQKLSMMAAFYLDKSPGLSSFYMSAGYELVKSESGDNSKINHHFCPACGTVYTATTCRVRYHRKKVPSHGRWANLVSRASARGNVSHLAPNTRRRLEKFLKARNRTVITCLKCGNCDSIDGATRIPRDQTAKFVSRQTQDLTSQKRKKKKRQKEINAGLTIKREKCEKDDVTGDCDVIDEKAGPSSSGVRSERKETKELKDIRGERVSHNTKQFAPSYVQRSSVDSSNGGKNPRKKRKKTDKINQLSAILAKEKGKRPESSLVDFLKHV